MSTMTAPEASTTPVEDRVSDTSETAATPEPGRSTAGPGASAATGAGGDAPADGQGDAGGGEVAYHLHLEREEAQVTQSALRLLIADEAHERTIRGLARDALAKVEAEPDSSGIVIVPLLPGEMKILHTAVKLLRDDLRREQADEQHVLMRVLEKLPDEHAIRAIVID